MFHFTQSTLYNGSMSALSKHWLIAAWPLWLFIVLFKMGAVLFFASLPPLGERVLPIWVVGLFIGGSALLQLVCDIPAGFLLDRFGYARLLKITTLILSLGGIILLLFGLNVWTYVALMIVSGFGWLFFGSGVDAYLLATVSRTEAGRYMGVRRSMSSLGAVMGTALLVFILPLPLAVLGAAVTGILLVTAFIPTLFAPVKKSVHEEVKLETHHYYIRRTAWRDIMRALKHLRPASGILASSNFAASTFYSVVWFTFPLLIRDLGQGQVLDFGLGIFDATTIICGGLLGRLADSKNKRLYILIGLLLFSTFGALLGFHLNTLFLLFGFLATAGDELSSASLWAWLNELNRDHLHDGVVAAVVNFFADMGWVVGPILAGFVYTYVGPSWTILIGASFIVFNWLVSAFLLRKNVYSMFHAQPLASRPHRYAHRD